jgi:hypothetical protein
LLILSPLSLTLTNAIHTTIFADSCPSPTSFSLGNFYKILLYLKEVSVFTMFAKQFCYCRFVCFFFQNQGYLFVDRSLHCVGTTEPCAVAATVIFFPQAVPIVTGEVPGGSIPQGF